MNLNVKHECQKQRLIEALLFRSFNCSNPSWNTSGIQHLDRAYFESAMNEQIAAEEPLAPRVRISDASASGAANTAPPLEYLYTNRLV